ncbi:MAG TPA: methylated-DNA--[protein]-cysteine S-methyltransferase [Candidatus Thermoplasmatota archaeon]|nr:methylated-DNA--[protein]-cysteine S-methyltransferase [Candidatus Thermoplasmatota archaeon]
MKPSEEPPFHERVFRIVQDIPRGRVASYGDVAALAGFPRSARHVARALRWTKKSRVPWHRVVGAAGEVRIHDPGLRKEQIRRLRREGVAVDERGRFSFARYAWDAPRSLR